MKRKANGKELREIIRKDERRSKGRTGGRAQVEQPEEELVRCGVCALVRVSVSWHLTHGRGKQIALTGQLTSHEMFCTFDRVSRESLATQHAARLEALF